MNPQNFNSLDFNNNSLEFDDNKELNLIVHIKFQKRNNKKGNTIIEGLDSNINYSRLLKDLKKLFNCGGEINKDELNNSVLILQGDQRINVKNFLINNKLVTEKQILIHGI